MVYVLTMDKFLSRVEARASLYLTKRKAKKILAKSRKKTILSEIWSWVDALVFAIFWVIIINQYLFQLFVIPSPSMVSTLLVGDRVIVNKDAYGVELYPAGKKIATGSRRVQRDNIITFYNPEYNTKGPVFDVLSQIVYMGTLTLVNIDKNEDGTPAERLYVKRAVGMGGDRISFLEGDVRISLAGTGKAIDESEFRENGNLSNGPHRSVDKKYYPGLLAAGALTAYSDNSLTPPQYLKDAYSSISGTDYDYKFDLYEFEKARLKQESLFNPSDMDARSSYSHYQNGIYVPFGYVLPLGDNRDNSRDGRYFGPVREDRINGQVVGRFWPLGRIGKLTDK